MDDNHSTSNTPPSTNTPERTPEPPAPRSQPPPVAPRPGTSPKPTPAPRPPKRSDVQVTPQSSGPPQPPAPYRPPQPPAPYSPPQPPAPYNPYPAPNQPAPPPRSVCACERPCVWCGRSFENSFSSEEVPVTVPMLVRATIRHLRQLRYVPPRPLTVYFYIQLFFLLSTFVCTVSAATAQQVRVT